MNRFFSTLVIAILLAIQLSTYSQPGIKTLVLRPGPADGIDADIRTDMPQTPRGSSPDFIANAWTAQGNYFTQRSLLKFDLSQVPTDATVLNATLFLYTNLNTGHYQLDSGANAAYLLRVTEPWSENLVVWDNQPAVSFLNPVILPQSVTHTQNYEVNVTAQVGDMVSNPSGNYGWSFRLQTEEKYRCMVFASSDNTMVEWRPKLVIQYTSCAEPVAAFNFSISSKNVQFTDISTPATSWNWTFGDGTGSTEQSPLHTYPGSGMYKACLEIHDSCGTSSHCDTVNIECGTLIAGFTSNFTNTTVTFTDTSHCAHPLSWLWEFGDSTTSTMQNPVHEYQNSEVYNVCLTISDSCGQDTHCAMVNLVPPLKPGFTFTQNEVNDLKVSFHDVSSGATWWLWDFGDGDSSPEQNPVHLYPQYGDYPVCLTAGNTITQETACNSLKVINLFIQPSGSSILVYPNPYTGNGKLNFVIFEDAYRIKIRIIDFTGRTIATQEYMDIRKNEPAELNIDRLGKGIYFLESTFNQYRSIVKIEVP